MQPISYFKNLNKKVSMARICQLRRICLAKGFIFVMLISNISGTEKKLFWVLSQQEIEDGFEAFLSFFESNEVLKYSK